MLAIRRVLMDCFERPLGVEAAPDFTWILESDRRCVRQSAYRLQIARDAAFDSPVFDSGRVDSDESAHVRAPIGALEPCAWYHARVKAWAGEEESAWREGAAFLTGMTRGWRAGFVTAEGDGDWRNSRGTLLRRAWTVRKPVRSAVV